MVTIFLVLFQEDARNERQKQRAWERLRDGVVASLKQAPYITGDVTNFDNVARFTNSLLLYN